MTASATARSPHTIIWPLLTPQGLHKAEAEQSDNAKVTAAVHQIRPLSLSNKILPDRRQTRKHKSRMKRRVERRSGKAPWRSS